MSAEAAVAPPATDVLAAARRQLDQARRDLLAARITLAASAATTTGRTDR